MAIADPPLHAVRQAVARALDEDLTPLGDLTSALLPAGSTGQASFVPRQAGTLAGTACATEAFAQLDPTVGVEWAARDGDAIAPGDVIGTVAGPLAAILTGERTALNFLCHLSGVATLTRRFVDAVAEGSDGTCRIWDTRKTTPGLRTLEKAAVRAGGAVNHRANLSDWVMFKDNHLEALGIADGVAAAKAAWPGRLVHVEATDLDELRQALEAGADAVLLDNMTPEQANAAVVTTDEWVAGGGTRPLLECSGGITLDTAAAYAATGVDLLSTSQITQSAPALDIGLDVT
ncbi:MAG: carboxylating nicotinate-nucleotide diphosphorylase [Acidimicrobiales bacterium]|nr:carboxylating nicotinate-nucleotide diphosphorylase [Acidimicrobiales bacterium]